MIKEETLISYWSKRISESDVSRDWADMAGYCWRCGDKERKSGPALNRCHIIPDCRGGKTIPSNIVVSLVIDNKFEILA